METVARLHRALAAAGKSGVKIGNYVHEICESVASLSAAARTSVSATYDCEQEVEAARALPTGFIIAEMLTNALKYAHPTGIPVRLRVSCMQADDASICIEVADDGVGLPERFDPSIDGGLGFRLMCCSAPRDALPGLSGERDYRDECFAALYGRAVSILQISQM